ncbi:MAG TPA: lipid-binding SYLF domain-containing protein [Casimicrobiaceae bacterium]|jgi:lipid-binding SYLF domain-containing protein|nr:lipid-binding SYLF domain-containing protein [Casimicrobiaceae bacterium]
MSKYKLSMIAVHAFASILLAAGSTAAIAQSDQTGKGPATNTPAKPTPQALVDAADRTFGDFMRDPQMTWLHDNIRRAKAILIAPEVAKVGFIFGGSGGRAVLLVRNAKTGRWSGPVFYTLATASVGFQAGVSVSQMMTLVMTDKGLNSLMSNSFKMGPDASVAAGPVGAGAKADIITDLVTYSRAKGLYGGINLDGTVVAISEDWNEAYYGKKGARAADILRGAARSKGADRLNADIARAAGKR